MTDTSAVADRLAAVRSRISDAGADPDDVVVVAVTKGFGVEALDAAAALGLDDVGENYAQELAEKWAAEPGDNDRRWHFLGRVQRNKVARLAGAVDVWQAVDRVAAGQEIARRAPGARVHVQVNLAGDPSRVGCTFADAPGLVGELRSLHLDVAGVTGIGPRGDPERARGGFRRLAELAAGQGLAECSMGMTDDLEVAVEEGSTMVRVGRGLFGTRTVGMQELG